MKKKLAFIDLSNYYNWPTGGMLEYELSILSHLVNIYDVDLWGVSVDNIKKDYILINNKKYKVNIFANVKTSKKIIPNFWKGCSIHRNKKFKEINYDIIYAHSGSCMTGAWFCKHKNKNIKFVYHQHGLSYLDNKSLMSYTQKPFYWFSQKKSNLVFLVTSPEERNKFVEKIKDKNKKKYVAIGSPINIDEFDSNYIANRIETRKNEKAKKVVYVGRLSPEKNVCDLIKSFSIYTKHYNSASNLLLIGDGPDKENIIKSIKEHKLENNVILFGVQKHSEIPEILKDCDMFLMPSKGEGVSISVLEAYASGLPVICYKVPGLEHQVIDGKTGYICKEKNNDIFAKMMNKCDKKKYSLAFNCLKNAKEFDVNVISKKICDCIDNI